MRKSENIQNQQYQFNDTGQESLVQLLIDNGADIKTVSILNSNALMSAIKGGEYNWKFIKTFYSKYCFKNNASFFLIGFEKIAELLIQKGADVNVIADNGDSALIIAAYKGK